MILPWQNRWFHLMLYIIFNYVVQCHLTILYDYIQSVVPYKIPNNPLSLLEVHQKDTEDLIF